jgi:ATP-binding cassette, subfamily A (ABC1), member 3
MLTGMTPISGGDALICGMSAKNQMSEVRTSIGVCPQHDILYPNLTAKEHLELYASLKGVPRDMVEAAIEKLFVDLKFERDKIHAEAGTLSGGQKRKLSMAIAFIGDSKVVFLDEPTSGVRPGLWARA